MTNRILVIDNEAYINRFLETRLIKEDFAVDVAADGLEAQKNIDDNKYDFILTDLMLPYVAGVELIMKIRSSALNAETPILVLSSVTSDDVIIDVLAAGAQDYIQKPFSMNVVLAKLKQHLDFKTAAA